MTPEEKINYALSLVEGAPPPPWGFFDHGGKPEKLKRDGGNGTSIAYVTRGMDHTDDEWEAVRAQLALSPLIPAALRLALAARRLAVYTTEGQPFTACRLCYATWVEGAAERRIVGLWEKVELWPLTACCGAPLIPDTGKCSKCRD